MVRFLVVVFHRLCERLRQPGNAALPEDPYRMLELVLASVIKNLPRLDLPQVIYQISHKLQSITGADNVIWVEKEKLAQLSRENYEIPNVGFRNADLFFHFYSHRITDAEIVRTQIAGLYDKFSSQWPNGNNSSDLKTKNEKFWIWHLGGTEVATTSYFIIQNPRSDRCLQDPGFKLLQEYIGALVSHAFELENVRQLSYIDDLTSLFNRRYLPLILDTEIKRCVRHQEKFSVLFIDVDALKAVNDSMGHMVGSKVLECLGRLIKEELRATDLGIRYGGDEYVIVLSRTDAAGAYLVAERLRSIVESTPFDINGKSVKITISIGVATFPDHATDQESILQMADEAMYKGKNSSRNAVIMAS